jgi:hypothetical protein
LQEKLNKIKLLNIPLIERIRELELDPSHESCIAGEGFFDKPPITNNDTKIKRLIHPDIDIKENIPFLLMKSEYFNLHLPMQLYNQHLHRIKKNLLKKEQLVQIMLHLY